MVNVFHVAEKSKDELNKIKEGGTVINLFLVSTDIAREKSDGVLEIGSLLLSDEDDNRMGLVIKSHANDKFTVPALRVSLITMKRELAPIKGHVIVLMDSMQFLASKEEINFVCTFKEIFMDDDVSLVINDVDITL